MAQSPAPFRTYFAELSVMEVVRVMLVSGCALALIFAGAVLPL